MNQYRTVQGDTWDMIAKKVYNDEKKMDILICGESGWCSF